MNAIMTDPYAHWKAALDGEKPKMYVDHPELGFYRMGVYEKQPNKARKRIGWDPVAIFMLSDELTAVIGPGRRAKTETNRDKLNELWSYIAGNPISEETYRAVAERGEPWPDSHETTVPSIPVANSSMTMDAPDAIAEHELIELRIRDAADQLGKYHTIESDEQASKARSLQQRFLELRSQAVKHYDALNRPLLDEQKRIRAVWFPLRDEADQGSDILRKAMGAWEDVKREAAKVAGGRTEAGQPVPSNVPPPATQIRGGAGRAASVSVEKVVTAIDIDMVFQHFRTNRELREMLTMLAQKAIKAGIDVPGATFEERSIVR